MNITPLAGFVVVKPEEQSVSVEKQFVAASCETRFVSVSKTAGRGDTKNNNSFVRLFSIISVSDTASEHIKSLIGKKVYCVCNENENSNYVIVDKESGTKIFILPEYSLLAEYKD